MVRPAARALDADASALIEAFGRVRAQTLALVLGLTAEDCAMQSMPDASPAKWHLAHTTWFFEVFALERFEKNFTPYHAGFRVLFNSYYNGVGDKHLRAERGLVSRPGLTTILEYRRNVETRIHALFADSAARTPAENAELAEIITLGFEHEQQHQELLLTDLKHLFSRNPLAPSYRQGWPLVAQTYASREWLPISGGLVAIGADAEGFAFDNERPRHPVFVAPFEIASTPVTCGDVLAFIDDDGYRRPELWLSLGWDTVKREGWQAPLYWQRDRDATGTGWRMFTLRGLADVGADVPAAHLSYFEAEAIARWSGARLPTEFEWELAASDQPIEGNFLENRVFHPIALSSLPAPGEPAQLFGDVWEWTQSAYLPYPGYRIAEGAIGEYNGKFMSQQMVLRGGSCATPRQHLRTSYRNFFPPEARWQFSGARLARDVVR
ncbi:MAG: ergothioneine biosynthesis protein EgtB [Proteobacteria bacterium]|nr:ergothioneine biosynthesis protein EgtB [Burkholderiales bacterium]